MEFYDYCCMLLPFKSNRRKEIPLFLCFFFLHSSIAIVDINICLSYFGLMGFEFPGD